MFMVSPGSNCVPPTTSQLSKPPEKLAMAKFERLAQRRRSMSPITDQK